MLLKNGEIDFKELIPVDENRDDLIEKWGTTSNAYDEFVERKEKLKEK